MEPNPVIDICSELTPDDPEFDLAERIINEIFELESANQGTCLETFFFSNFSRFGSSTEYINAVNKLDW